MNLVIKEILPLEKGGCIIYWYYDEGLRVGHNLFCANASITLDEARVLIQEKFPLRQDRA